MTELKDERPMTNDEFEEEWAKYPKKKIKVDGYEVDICYKNCQCLICQEAREIRGIANKALGAGEADE